MKKFLLFAFLFFILFFAMPSQTVSHEANAGDGYGEEAYQVIPDEAIRLRILANSDSDKDQQLKYMVRDQVNEEITSWVQDITNIEEARKLIESRTPEIENIVENVLEEAGEAGDAEVDYGKNVAFPTRQYGPYTYPEGTYEAVLITLGEGNGANWWCVLFPPLCFLDFSGEASTASEASNDPETTDEAEETEVKFFLFEWFGWS